MKKISVEEICDRVVSGEILYFSDEEPTIEELENKYERGIVSVECIGQYINKEFFYNGNDSKHINMKVEKDDYVFKIEFWKFK